ncbi:MAG: hypothetical protein ABSC04_21770 [Syntrophobacteraceae bacterium]|jgi:site-specific recombinase XerD
MSVWQNTIIHGIRYRVHPTRKTKDNLPDKYFVIRHTVNRKTTEEKIGWATKGNTLVKANYYLSKLKRNHENGEGPQTLEELLKEELEETELYEQENEHFAQEAITFAEIFSKNYFPQTKEDKTKRSFDREQSLFKIWLDPVIGKIPLKNIRPFHLEKIKKNMAEKGKAAGSVRYALAVARQVFNFAKNNKIFSGESPTSQVKFPQADNRRDRFLSVEEANKLLDVLTGMQ